MGWSLDAAAKAEIDRILAETIHDPVGPSSWPRRECVLRLGLAPYARACD